MSDVLGQAIHDYFNDIKDHQLWIHNKYGSNEEMPVETYFRDEDDMPDLEWVALNECRGSVLDIGAGAGSHSLVLQQRGFNVTALEISPLAAAVIKSRGVKEVEQADVFKYSAKRYDTLLLLMNGIGLAGNLTNLRAFLRHAKNLINDGGQLLFDSSDVAYLYEGNLPSDVYHGEISYRYEYRSQITEWFNWLYVDEATMLAIAAEEGWQAGVLYEDEFGQYLMRLTIT